MQPLKNTGGKVDLTKGGICPNTNHIFHSSLNPERNKLMKKKTKKG